eukprot:TRINITY_DN62895_c0_g1_i1.p1 TRINITY_DN62895_c0_g1~~TRINITY_DN62895_c0_g1_i1.p1  ORF type:complete len:344 (-),score=34.43 TRINITY_DN62895_c0_g1_i1:14-1045(-)
MSFSRPLLREGRQSFALFTRNSWHVQIRAVRSIRTPARNVAMQAQTGEVHVAGGARVSPSQFISRTAGTTVALFGASILAWPFADLFLAPSLVAIGLGTSMWGRAENRASDGEKSTLEQAVSRGGVDSEHKINASPSMAQIRFLSLAGEGSGRAAERASLAVGRPTMYVSLRTATTPNDLVWSMARGAYGRDRLGFIGQLSLSVGVWWNMLFDMLISHDSNQNRAFHFSVMLQHIDRGISRSAWFAPRERPLIILDHVDEAASYATVGTSGGMKEMEALRSMLVHLSAWCATVCFDHNNADFLLCGWPENVAADGSGPRLEIIETQSALRALFMIWLSGSPSP